MSNVRALTQSLVLRLWRLPGFPLRAVGQPFARGLDGAYMEPPSGEAYVSVVFQALAVFRFFSFAMGAGLAFFLNLGDDPPVSQALLISVVGLYNMVRVLWRFNPASHRLVIILLTLGSDVALSVVLVLLTGGLDSAFLIYSLAPILTAGLMMDGRSAVAVGAISGLSVAGGYVAQRLGVGS